MPATNPDFIFTQVEKTASFHLEPVFNALNTLSLLSRVTQFGGLSRWIPETHQKMSVEQIANNELLFEGIPYALMPERSWETMPAFISHLTRIDPNILRERLLSVYASIPPLNPDTAPPAPTKLLDLLAGKKSFIQFLQSRFAPQHLNLELESHAYDLLVAPDEMQNLIISHLTDMWQNFLADEWERTLPMLNDCVAAFSELDLTGKSKLEVARMIMGQTADEKWYQLNKEASPIVFVPSPHIGPYFSKFKTDENLYIIFGARLPKGSSYHAPDLSRSELLVRLNALADDNRLRILALVAQENEICAKEIINQLSLSQSAASRHLRQLTATGYLSERRKEGAKCYQLNDMRLEDTFSALERFVSEDH